MFRLKDFRKDHNKLTQLQMAKILGCSQNNISVIETEGKDLTREQLETLFEQYGESHILEYVDNINNISDNTPHLEYPQKAIPHIEDAIAVCGMPSGFEIAIKKNQCELYMIPDLKGCDFTIRAGGDSMINRKNPKRSIRDRDIVGCRLWQSRTHLRWGEVYALATADGVVIKKIMPSEKDGHIQCVSFNEEDGYPPYDLNIGEIQDWAIVVGVVSISNWV